MKQNKKLEKDERKKQKNQEVKLFSKNSDKRKDEKTKHTGGFEGFHHDLFNTKIILPFSRDSKRSTAISFPDLFSCSITP